MLAQLNNIYISGSRFLRNRGQALRVYQLFQGAFLIDGCVFDGNQPSDKLDGAALSFKESPLSTLRLTRSEFRRNRMVTLDTTTDREGGALNLKSNAFIDSSFFEANDADAGGAPGRAETVSRRASRNTCCSKSGLRRAASRASRNPW